ncbi:PucR family transcriptional regulator [Nocardia lasii]|uniref:PucR family transcriptional regulator n=1 Tax=Nocardia lasii TaxID=1616107 RepID=UPI00366AC779
MITLNFAYIDSISEQVMVEYQAERERWLSHRRTVRMEVLERLLGPYPPDTDAAEAVLGYALRHHHLGVVLWTGSTMAAPARLTGLEDIVARIAETLRATEQPLIWPRDSNTLWAWIPWRPSISQLDEDRLAEILRTEADDVRLALGAPGNDVEGFRQTHNDAIRAARVASIADRHSRPITSYTDPGVRTAALLSADLDAAQRMVGAALGPLAADEPATALLRETVRVFLDEKGSYVAAAARLHVHKNTVKYRLARAVERRGAPIESDRLDVELALVAAHWLGPSVLTAAPTEL